MNKREYEELGREIVKQGHEVLKASKWNKISDKLIYAKDIEKVRI